MRLLPTDAIYYFTQASVKRALPAEKVQELAATDGLKGQCYPSVGIAVRTALENAEKDDLIFVGGSSFIVADLLSEKENGSFSCKS